MAGLADRYGIRRRCCGSAGDEKGRGERLLREVQYGLIDASQLVEVGLTAKEMLVGRQGRLLCDLALSLAIIGSAEPEICVSDFATLLLEAALDGHADEVRHRLPLMAPVSEFTR